MKNLSKKELINIIKERSIIYSEANLKVDCENLSKKEIIDKIIKIYEN